MKREVVQGMENSTVRVERGGCRHFGFPAAVYVGPLPGPTSRMDRLCEEDIDRGDAKDVSKILGIASWKAVWK